MTFVRSEAAPQELRGAALVALHGSWNRTKKDGYKVVSLTWGRDGGITEQDFLTGFLKDEDVIGRPVDVAEGPDGAFYVSDDYAGSIYRVALGQAPQPAPTASSSTGEAANPLSALAPAEIAQDTARGEALFERYGCAGCHIPERAEKGVVAKPLERLAQRYTVPSLEAFLAAPTPPMPVFPLSDSDRRALAVHLLATRP
jgi:mono/diheme cytochrome c family protein